MKKAAFLIILIACLSVQQLLAQDCKTNADLDAVPGKYLTADQYPWPAVKAAYFSNMATTADKAVAKQVLGQIEKTEEKSHAGFNLTGGNWENYYSTEGYRYLSNAKLGTYTFQSALYEYFCAKGKLTRNSEYSTVLRIYVNAIPVNTLNRFLDNPFGSSIGPYDFGLQYLNWKNHQPADVNAPLINLFTYFSCNSEALLNAINNGNQHFQDVAEKDIKPNNRSNFIYRYWFAKKSNLPVLLPVSRKEYLQSLLEYYEREKLYFPKLIDKLTKDRDLGVKQYNNWEADVNDKVAIVKKALAEHDAQWLSAQAVINRIEDATKTYKAQLTERTNYNRFWRFYDSEKKSVPLYQYNPAYFKTGGTNLAKPQIISVAFRYVSIPLSLKLLNHFSENFDFEALKKMVE